MRALWWMIRAAVWLVLLPLRCVWWGLILLGMLVIVTDDDWC